MNEVMHITGSSLLSLLIASPLVGVLALLLVPKKELNAARFVARLTAALSFVLSVGLLWNFPRQAAAAPDAISFQFAEVVSWVPSLGLQYAVGIDGISLWLLVLTTFLTLLVTIASTSVTSKVRAYLACVLLLEVGILGSFAAIDGLTFYVFWELMLIPMYFLIGVWGGKRRVYAALKFVLYTALGSLLMLVAIVYLAYLHSVQFGTWSFFLGDWMKLSFTLREEITLFAAFAFAFAIKIPMFPLHTWLPDAHVEAPTGGSVILAGVMLKLGIYGLIRWGIPIFPTACVLAAPLFAVLGVVGIVYGALVAWVQTDIKKLVAYSSVSHLGFCVLGFASLNLRGLQGSLLQLINHGVSTAALFFLVGVLYDRKHTREIEDYQGLARKVPVFAIVFLVFTLSSIGLPLTNGFVGEFLVLLGAFQYSPPLTAAATLGVILGALYMLSLYRRVMFGDFNADKNDDLEDLNSRERLVFAPLLLAVFVIGLYPKPILDDLEPATLATLRNLRSRDGFLGYKRASFGGLLERAQQQSSTRPAELEGGVVGHGGVEHGVNEHNVAENSGVSLRSGHGAAVHGTQSIDLDRE